MDFREKKWQLMQRDPLCVAFDKILHNSLNDPNNDHLRNLREKLEKQLEKKWCVNVYIPEARLAFGQAFEMEPDNPRLKDLRKEDFVGPFKSVR